MWQRARNGTHSLARPEPALAQPQPSTRAIAASARRSSLRASFAATCRPPPPQGFGARRTTTSSPSAGVQVTRHVHSQSSHCSLMSCGSFHISI